MPSNRIIAVCCLAAALCSGAGCSKEYEHERLDKDSAHFAAVQAMIDELRAAEEDQLDDVLDRQIADGPDASRVKGLRYVLGGLAKAETVKLKRVDRWGSDLYRATLLSTTNGRKSTLALLLILIDDERFYWANTN